MNDSSGVLRKPLQEIHREAGGRHDLGAQPGEVLGAMPRVVGDRARQRRAVPERVLHVIGQPLGALADRAVVDRVRADRIHLAAPAAGAERDHRPEHVVEHLPLAGRDVRGDFVGVFGVARLGEPGADVLGGRGADAAIRGTACSTCRAILAAIG